ncbi:hypothetical protein ACIREM_07200 [Streptomyces shenzhenensis]
MADSTPVFGDLRAERHELDRLAAESGPPGVGRERRGGQGERP